MPIAHFFRLNARLDSRLSLCASFVRPGSRVADIGTDHAYLPAHLVGTGVCPFAVAADIRPGPLSRAADTVERTGLTGKIDLRLGDGLSPVRPEEVDDIVIAGMGGETIAAILAAAPWTQDARYRLILQPMSKPEELRRFLLQTGYAIQEERIARDGERLYAVLQAGFSPSAAKEQLARPAAVYRGGVDSSDPDGRAYLLHQAQRLDAAAAALRKAASRKDNAFQKEDASLWEEGYTDRADRLAQLAEQLKAGVSY